MVPIGSPKLPFTPRFRDPFAPFRAPAESGQGIMIMFSCAYFEIKAYRRIVLKQGSERICLSRFTDCPTTETQVEKTLKGF